MKALLFLPACSGFVVPGRTLSAVQDPTTRFSVMSVQEGPPWPVPGPPPSFAGAQWAPWVFGTALSPPPGPELRATSTLKESVTQVVTAGQAAPVASATPPGFFKVTLKTPTGEVQFDCPPDAYILDHVDEIIGDNEALAAAQLPYACRAGSCSACAAKVQNGARGGKGFRVERCLLRTVSPTLL